MVHFWRRNIFSNFLYPELRIKNTYYEQLMEYDFKIAKNLLDRSLKKVVKSYLWADTAATES